MNKQTFEIRRVLVRLFGDGLLSGFMKCLLSVRQGKTPPSQLQPSGLFRGNNTKEFSAAIISRYRIAQFYSKGNLM